MPRAAADGGLPVTGDWLPVTGESCRYERTETTMTDSEQAGPPDGLGELGLRLWDEITGAHDIDERQAEVLEQACRLRDDLAALEARYLADGRVIEGPTGPRVHPALTEARLARDLLNKLLASLRLPDESGARPQRRSGGRGAYGNRGTAVVVSGAPRSRWPRSVG